MSLRIFFRPSLIQGDLISLSLRMYLRMGKLASQMSVIAFKNVSNEVEKVVPCKKLCYAYWKPFFIFITPSWSFSFVNRIAKNIRKWSETSDLIIPFFRKSLKMSVVRILWIRLAECSEIWVGRFIQEWRLFQICYPKSILF